MFSSNVFSRIAAAVVTLVLIFTVSFAASESGRFSLATLVEAFTPASETERTAFTPGICDIATGVLPIEVESSAGTPIAAYPTLSDTLGAFQAINNGTHQGVITIDICGNPSENVAAVLNASGTGGASYTSINISPAGGAARTVASDVPGGAMIDLVGADNVVIDGLNTGGNSLTISNDSISTTGQTSTIRFTADATNNTIRNTTIRGSASGALNTGTIFFGLGTATGNDGNVIQNNDITANSNFPNNGVIGLGSTTSTAHNNSGIQIIDNRISDFFRATAADWGIFVSTGNTGWTITGNSFFQTAARLNTNGAIDGGIQINNGSGNGFNISNNFIGGSAPNAGGTAWTIAGAVTNRFRGVSLSIGSATASSVQGNTIANFAFASTSSAVTTGGPWNGIYLGTGDANIGTVTGNTIGAPTGNGSININITSSSGSISSGIFCDATGTVSNISNNTIGSISFSASTVSQGFQGIATTTGSTFTISNNVIGSTTTANSINVNSGATSTINQIVRGIFNSSSAALSITGNTIANINNNYLPSSATSTSNVLAGISSSAGTNTITGNSVRNLATPANHTGSAATTPVIGILLTSAAAGQTVSENTVHTLSETHSTQATRVSGVHFTGTNSNVIARNRIYGLSNSSTNASAEINGINIAGGTSDYRNNMIAVGAGVSNAIQIAGINEASGTNNIFHNSIYIGGSPTSGAGNTFAFFSQVTSNTRSFRNNIFVNARNNVGASGKNYAVSVGGAGANPAGLTINNNVYQATGTGAVFGLYGGADIANLAAWQSAVGQDANSFESNPQFIDPSNSTPDLHIHPSLPTIIEANGADVGVIDDFDGQLRASLTPVDIGADAGNFTAPGGTTTINFSNASFIEDESQTAILTIIRTGNVSGTSTVDFAASSGTASGGASCGSNVDFISASGTLTFNPTETSKSINVVLCTDTVTESGDNFTVTLSNPLSPAVLGSPSMATVNINDTAAQFRNTSSITLNGIGPGSPYPATINISGGPNIIGRVRVTLFDVSHNFADDIDVLLVGPAGQNIILMADAGGTTGLTSPSTPTFVDSASQFLPDSSTISTGIYKPTSWEPGQPNFPAPAPTGPYNEPGNTSGGPTLASVFNLGNSNGTWSLYVRNDGGGTSGTISGGWGLEVLPPTVSSVSLSGRVTTADGSGIVKARVTIAGGNLPQSMEVITGPFGYYRFEGLLVGQTYVVSVASKRFIFKARVINLDDELTDVDFVAEP